MNQIGIYIFGVLVFFAVIQTLCALAFTSSLCLPKSDDIPDELLPKAVVILALRGADPFLADCIRALLHQNYPEYELHIVVDSQQDPAWDIITKTIQQTGATHVKVSPLIVQHNTCSLKCSALVQAIFALDDSYNVVAFIDADVVAYPNWLRELVVPLMDKQIGASTGNRWYLPPSEQWGSLVRYVYNSASVVSMYIHKYAWGGSMAMKLSNLRQAQLLDIWTQSLSVDAPVHKALQSIGLKVKFVPTVMMINREDCDLAQCFRFITRQLIMPRLYHPKWMVFVLQVFVPSLALVVAMGMMLISLVRGNFAAAALFGGGFVGYILVMALLITHLEQGVRQMLWEHSKLMKYFSFRFLVKVLLVVPLAQLISTLATALTMSKQNVEWRGVVYQVKSPYEILLTEYHPYQKSPQPLDSKASIG
ncbi:glycosyltransferase family 2 protein [Nostoc sp. UCD121]|uniref:glycosyltransferase n=1 Tax=unclassified Nostoc TaxID=2593658 RepID=UPI001629B75A|nr:MULTISPECIES: glycosyltransferase family 2 protein [unclassified Nostoc]MBC1224093.1 glycosyltransferase family 2 protein [Nostoc sp. UCD120]MBC1274621.1 glycosyltransferase family 2 protein [Nostoc sp. UCD121]MBC1298590.1 glycosyltransferase family 2 protein [Nostoc sp. UCD122]